MTAQIKAKNGIPKLTQSVARRCTALLHYHSLSSTLRPAWSSFIVSERTLPVGSGIAEADGRAHRRAIVSTARTREARTQPQAGPRIVTHR